MVKIHIQGMSNSFVVTFDKILKFSRTYVGKLQKAREWGQFFRLGRGKIFFYLLDTEAALHAARLCRELGPFFDRARQAY